MPSMTANRRQPKQTNGSDFWMALPAMEALIYGRLLQRAWLFLDLSSHPRTKHLILRYLARRCR